MAEAATNSSRAVADDDDTDNLRLSMQELDEWKKESETRPLRVMVCGLGGAGKSTLINTFLQLEGEDKQATVGMRGRATTTVVSKYEKKTKRGIIVCCFDTPGLNDSALDDDETIAKMELETGKKLDIVFYCLSLGGSARVQGADAKVMKLLTQAFSSHIWRKTVIVLTFANHLEMFTETREGYNEVIKNITEEIKNVLKDKAHVQADIVDTVPIVSAGKKNLELKYEVGDKRCWEKHLFDRALMQVNPKMLPALFAVHLRWKDIQAALGGMSGGAVVGVGVGVPVGALCGEILGPIGAAVGAGIGAGVGAVVGGMSGIGVGTATFHISSIKHIIRIKYKKWKLKHTKSSQRYQTIASDDDTTSYQSGQDNTSDSDDDATQQTTTQSQDSQSGTA